MQQRIERRVRTMVKSGPNAGKLRGLDKNCVKLLMQCGSKLSRAMFLEAIDVTMCPNVSGFPQGEALSTRPNQKRLATANASDNSSLCTLLICTNLSCYTVFIWCDSTTSNTGRT